MKEQIKQKLLSRKFLLALGTVLVFVANNQYSEAMGVVMAYLGVEGLIDTKRQKETKEEVEI